MPGPSHLCCLEHQVLPSTASSQRTCLNLFPYYLTQLWILLLSFPVFSLPTPSPPTGCGFHCKQGNAHANSITRQPPLSWSLAHSLSRRAGDVAHLLDFMKRWVPPAALCKPGCYGAHPEIPVLGREVDVGLKVQGHPWLHGFRTGLACRRHTFLKNPRKIDRAR